MSSILIHKIQKPLSGTIRLSGSKSISNRLLIIQALCEESFHIDGLADAEDTRLLQEALASDSSTLDVHHAGTSYRFLTSYLCLQKGTQVLTGSSRMKERPIKPLVDVLRQIGAQIEYLEKDGFPPLKIGKAEWVQQKHPIDIDASISSQFISSLLLIAPKIPGGLSIRLVGELVSRPYLEMTLNLMAEFGIAYDWTDDTIRIAEQVYRARDFVVEADWSAASYYFSLVALIPGSEIFLEGLHPKSIQGDARVVDMMSNLGVEATYEHDQWRLRHVGSPKPVLEWNFIREPDVAQTIAVTCGGLGTMGLFTGLQTLLVKETDRIHALQMELQKVSVYFSKLPEKFAKKTAESHYILEGKAMWEDMPTFDTYRDHRMAMAFAAFASINDICINEPDVVAKSYPNFWLDLAKIGIKSTIQP